MLVSMKQLVDDALKGGYALGAFSTQNLETTLGIIRAAEDCHSPVIIQISESAIRDAGVKPITHIVQSIAKNAAVDIPIALHLDHGKRFLSIAECIHAGFSSIMISAAELPYEENCALTKQVASYAHERGVWAQGELGQVLSAVPREEALTDPRTVRQFVKETGVDTLTVAVGNVWGVVQHASDAESAFDGQRLRSIHNEVPHIPLVLHGASGLSKKLIDEARTLGVLIITVDAELRWTFTNQLRTTLRKDTNAFDLRDILEPSVKAVHDLVSEKLELFGSVNRA